MPARNNALARNFPTPFWESALRGEAPASGRIPAVKVFLVEDSPILRERLEKMLSAIPGAQTVGHAPTARAAIAAIAAAKPDVVVLDIQLEEGSGFDVLRAVRPAAPQVHFYVLSNFAHEGYRRMAEKLGARGFFDKSQEIGALRDTLAAAAV
jgi:DNA-binding NarL/FixJ family response regulator